MGNEENKDGQTEDQNEFSEFSKRLEEKYADVFDEPIPERLAELIRRLKEIKS